MKTLLAIILFGVALKASGVGFFKRPVDVPVIPGDSAAKDDDPQGDPQDNAQRKAEKFLSQAQAYVDTRPMTRLQHKALARQIEHLGELHRDEHSDAA
jgi:hypothetical protein